MPMRNFRIFIFCLIGTVLIGLSIWYFFRYRPPVIHFNGERAYKDVVVQVNFGPRTPGSSAHAQTIVYIQQELERAGWQAYVQDAPHLYVPAAIALVLISFNPAPVETVVSLPVPLAGPWNDAFSSTSLTASETLHLSLAPYEVRVLTR